MFFLLPPPRVDGSPRGDDDTSKVDADIFRRRQVAQARTLLAVGGCWRRGPSGGWRPRVGQSRLIWDALKRENTGIWRVPVCYTSFVGDFGGYWVINSAFIICKIHFGGVMHKLLELVLHSYMPNI
jgi:hypothetical protein